MQQISRAELEQWQRSGKHFVLIDVREPWEHEAFSIGGRLIPLGALMAAIPELPKDVPAVLYCEKGIRSVLAIQRLEASGFENLYNLSGGMKAWRASEHA